MRLSGSTFTNFPEATGCAAGLLTFSAAAALANNKDVQINDESQCKGVLLKRTYILLKTTAILSSNAHWTTCARKPAPDFI
jgi:hypothetical protein